MRREPRPTFVRCSGPCRRDRVDARTAAEIIVVLVFNNSSKGGTHGAHGHIHGRAYICRECDARVAPVARPEARITVEKMAEQLTHFLFVEDRLFDVPATARRKHGQRQVAG